MRPSNGSRVIYGSFRASLIPQLALALSAFDGITPFSFSSEHCTISWDQLRCVFLNLDLVNTCCIFFLSFIDIDTVFAHYTGVIRTLPPVLLCLLFNILLHLGLLRVLFFCLMFLHI